MGETGLLSHGIPEGQENRQFGPVARAFFLDPGYHDRWTIPAALREDVDLLARTAFLSRLTMIAGLVYDVESGHLEDVVRWERPD